MKTPKEEFLRRTQPMSWIEKYVCLKLATDTLLKEIRENGNTSFNLTISDELMQASSKIGLGEALGGPYMLLAGSAIENLMKAIYLRDNQAPINEDEGKLEKDFLTHGLVKLATRIGLVSKKKDDPVRRALERLSRFVIWGGRYPVPKEYTHDQNIKFDLTKDPEMVDQIFKKLQEMAVEKGVLPVMSRLNWPP